MKLYRYIYTNHNQIWFKKWHLNNFNILYKILKRWKYYTYIHTYIHTYIYVYHVDLKYVYKNILLFTNCFMKKNNNLQDIIIVQMYEIMKI